MSTTLRAVLNLSDPETVTDDNFNTIAANIFQRFPTLQNGVANTVTGPPTTGAWVVGDLWRDQNLALWRCTVAGTPGTWVQIEAAPVANTAGFLGTPTSNYVIADRSAFLKLYRWNGAAWAAV